MDDDRTLTIMNWLVCLMILMVQTMPSSRHNSWFLLMDIFLLPCQCGCIHQLQHVYIPVIHLHQTTMTLTALQLLTTLTSTANLSTGHHKSHLRIRQQQIFHDFQGRTLSPLHIMIAPRYSTRYLKPGARQNEGCIANYHIYGIKEWGRPEWKNTSSTLPSDTRGTSDCEFGSTSRTSTEENKRRLWCQSAWMFTRIMSHEAGRAIVKDRIESTRYIPSSIGQPTQSMWWRQPSYHCYHHIDSSDVFLRVGCVWSVYE